MERALQRGDSGGVCSWQEHKSREIKRASRLRVVWFNKVPAKDCGLSPAIRLGPAPGIVVLGALYYALQILLPHLLGFNR